VSRHFEVRLLHEYLEMLARLKHAKLRAFGSEAAALRWLRAAEPSPAEPAPQP
jgi:hypothetical protein